MKAALLVLGVSLLLASTAQAVDRGDTCTLRAPLPMTVVTSEGRIDTVVDAGIEIKVEAVGDEGRLRINTGDASGIAATRDYVAACQGSLEVCSVEQELMLYEKTRSDSRSWRLKRGATVSVLKRGKVWAHLRVGDLEGYSLVKELTTSCATRDQDAFVKETPVTEEVERGEGPGVLFLPFYQGPGAPVAVADQLSELFFERLAAYRPDAATLPLRGKREGGMWKALVSDAAARARGAGMGYALIATLDVGSGADKGVLSISMALVDAKRGVVLKGARTQPSLRPTDTWPESLLAVLLPFAGEAPGARPPPAIPKEAPATATDGQEAAVRTVDDDILTAPAWYANPWGYLLAGATVAAGAGAGAMGFLAVNENDAANALGVVDAARLPTRETALGYAIAADALTVAAVGLGIGTIVVFATGAGQEPGF